MPTNFNIHELFPKRYLDVTDLGDKQYTLIMDEVRIEEMGKDRKRNPVLYFKNAKKGLVLNRTNGEIIGKLYGDQTGLWRDRRITLYVTEVKAFGQMQDVIRVVDAIPSAPQAKKEEQAPAPASDPIVDTLTAGRDPADPDNDEDFFNYQDDGDEEDDLEDQAAAMQREPV